MTSSPPGSTRTDTVCPYTSRFRSILEYQERPELVGALAQGKVDVVPTMRWQAFGIMEAVGERAEGLAVGETFFEDVMAIGLRENDSDWRDWVNWALQRLWADGTYQALYKKHYRMEIGRAHV